MKNRVLLSVFILILCMLGSFGFVNGTGNGITRITNGYAGTLPNQSTIFSYKTISANGRYVAFTSDASNLVPGDTNNKRDVFVFDRQLRITERVSVASNGAQANQSSGYSSISGDGRFVVFNSLADNLVQGDNNAMSDIFIHDRDTNQTNMVTVGSYNWNASRTGAGKTAISFDGRYIVFVSDGNGLSPFDTDYQPDVYLFDRTFGTMTLVSFAYDNVNTLSYVDSSNSVAISADGCCIAFESPWGNVASNDTNAQQDIFVYDRRSGINTLVSVASDGTQIHVGGAGTPSLSADGRYVTFTAVGVDIATANINSRNNIFVHDMQTGITLLASPAYDGHEGNGRSLHGSISGNGRFVAFDSSSSNLIDDDTNQQTDVFIRDMLLLKTVRVSVSANGIQANGGSEQASISGDGSVVTFESFATNFVSSSSNPQQTDIFAALTLLVYPDPPNASPQLNYFSTHTPTLTWHRVTGRSNYEIEINRTADFSAPSYKRTISGLSHIVEISLDDGVWYWRVRAVNGTWSAPESFIVVTQ